MKKWKVGLFSLLLVSVLGACSTNGQTSKETGKEKLSVITTFYPMYDFTKNIVGDEGEVKLLIPAGTEPHDYEPSAKEIASIHDADIFVYHNEKIINDNDILAKARHEITTNLDEVVSIASKSLNVGGYFYLVHTSSRIIEIIESLKKYKFGIKRIVPVYDNRNDESSLILIEALYGGKDYVKIDKPVYIDENKTYQGIFGGTK